MKDFAGQRLLRACCCALAVSLCVGTPPAQALAPSSKVKEAADAAQRILAGRRPPLPGAGAMEGKLSPSASRSLESLVKALEDPDLAVCMGAAKVLSEQKNKKAIKPLIRALARAGVGEREIKRISGALEVYDPDCFDGEDCSNLFKIMVQWDAKRSRFSFGIAADSLMLRRILGKSGVRLSYLTAGILGQTATPETRARSIRLLNFCFAERLSPYPHGDGTQENAVEILGGKKHEQAGQALCAVMASLDKGTDKGTRLIAVKALGCLMYRGAVEPLILQGLKSKDTEEVNSAAWALGEIGDEQAGEALIPLLKRWNTSVVDYAAGALGKLKFSNAVEPLCQLLKGPIPLRTTSPAVVWALGEMRDARAAGPLVREFNWNKSDEILEAMGKIKDPRIVKRLLYALRIFTIPNLIVFPWAYRATMDHRLHTKVIKLLGEIGDPSAVGGIAWFLGDLVHDTPVSISAVAAARAAETALLAIDKPAREPLKREIKKWWIPRDTGWKIGAQRVLVLLDDDETVDQVIRSHDWNAKMVVAVAEYYERRGGGEKMRDWLHTELRKATGKLNWRNHLWVQMVGRDEDVTRAVQRALHAAGDDAFLASLEEIVMEAPAAQDRAKARPAPLLKVQAAYFDRPSERILDLLELLKVREAFNWSVSQTQCRTAALLRLLRDSQSREETRQYLLTRMPEALPALAAALKAPYPEVQRFAMATLQEAPPEMLTGEAHRAMGEYRDFMRQMGEMQRDLRDGNVAGVVEKFDRMKYARQALEVAKLITAPDVVEPLALVLVQTNRCIADKGDLLRWWLEELASVQYAQVLEQSQNPQIQKWAGTIDGIRGILEGFTAARKQFADGHLRQAQDILEQEFCLGVQGISYALARHILFDPRVPVGFKLVIVRAVEETNKKIWGDRTEFLLDPIPERSLYPLEFGEEVVVSAEKPAGSRESRAVSPAKETSYIDLVIGTEEDVACDL